MLDQMMRRMNQVLLFPFSILMILFFAFVTPSYSQQTTGNVRGIVKDPTEAVVTNAKVTILDKKTNTSQNTVTTGSGEY